MANSNARCKYYRATFIAAACVVVSWVTPAHAADPATERRLGDIDSRLNRLEGVLGNKVLVEMLRRIEDMQRELQAARDATERTAYELEGIKDRQRELYLDIDRRLRALETAAPEPAPAPAPPDEITAAPPANEPAPPLDTATTPAPPDDTPNAASADNGQAYRDAFDLLKNGQYDESIAAFNRFLGDYPQSTYASNAQYWLAEANYVSSNYERAATEFSKVIEQYPDSSKVPDARLKLGFTCYELEQWDRARQVLNEVSRQHPNTTVARLAESRLQRMDREGN